MVSLQHRTTQPSQPLWLTNAKAAESVWCLVRAIKETNYKTQTWISERNGSRRLVPSMSAWRTSIYSGILPKNRLLALLWYFFRLFGGRMLFWKVGSQCHSSRILQGFCPVYQKISHQQLEARLTCLGTEFLEPKPL